MLFKMIFGAHVTIEKKECLSLLLNNLPPSYVSNLISAQ